MKVTLPIFLLSFCLFALGSLQATPTQNDLRNCFISDLQENVGLKYDEDPQLPLDSTEYSLENARANLIAMQQLLEQYSDAHRYFQSYINSLIVGQTAIVKWIESSLAENANRSDSEE